MDYTASYNIMLCMIWSLQKEMVLTEHSSSKLPNSTSGSAYIRKPSTWTFFRGSMYTLWGKFNMNLCLRKTSWNCFNTLCNLIKNETFVWTYMFYDHQVVNEKSIFTLEKIPHCFSLSLFSSRYSRCSSSYTKSVDR